jgi:hypothetical protein
MNTALAARFISELDAILLSGRALRLDVWTDSNASDEHQVQAFITRCRAAIERATGPESSYRVSAAEVKGPNVHEVAELILGITQALRDDLAAGYLSAASELIHASTFADFLEMADHLAGEGYKDAAAVIAGSSLEAHLRNLCVKNSIATDFPPGSGKPKKADTMNGELGTANAYTKLDQKSVTSWLDLRNKAAHGEYAKYTQAQVELLISGIRDFINRNPA